jgi:diguanylate cyclase (GGDEF)-like protein/PAS domain S-box-containing protein
MVKRAAKSNTLINKLGPIELLLHVLVAGLLVFKYWHELPQTHLLAFLWAVGGVSLIRAVFLVLVGIAAKVGTPGLLWGSGALHLLGYFAAGLVWGNIPTALIVNGWARLLSEPYPVVAIVCAALSSLVGASLRDRQFLAFAVCACGVPFAVSLWSGHIEQAGMWGALAVVMLVIAYTTGRLAQTADLYRQVNQGHSELMKKLAVARDEAVQNQRAAEQASQAIKQEILERQRAEEKIRASEQELSAILRDMQDTFFRTNRRREVLRISPSVHHLLGYRQDEVTGRSLQDLFVDSGEFKRFVKEMESRLGIVENFEVRLRHRLSHEVWASINAHYYDTTETKNAGIEGTVRDISAGKEAAEALFQEKERLHVTLESIGDGVITTDMRGVVEYINTIGEQMTGWSDEEARGQPLPKILQLINEDSSRPVELPMAKWLTEGQRAALANPAMLVHCKKKSLSAIELTGSPIRDSAHGVIGAVLVFHDVTKLRSLARQLSHQASHDALTGLINRREFEKRLDHAIQSAHGSDKVHALCYLDMDQFKVVNDTCGHHAGDELLKQVTTLLRKLLRESDTLARLGGDEFGVLLMGCHLDKAATIAEKLRQAVEDFRFVWDGKTFRVGLSIGVVPIDAATTGLTELQGAADAACYVAKERGRNYVHVYEPQDAAVAEHHGQMQWMQRIQRALDHDLFTLYFQPIISLKDPAKDIGHGELLLRMLDDQKPEGENIVMPNAFIPAAERYHLMPQVDRWVLRHALHALADEQGPASQVRQCSVNLSGQSIGDLKLMNFILDLLRETGVSPKRLCFEITESAVISNLEAACDFISKLKKLGCRFALDDFGSGLSSFAYLKNLPVDYLKLDGSLVRDMATSKVNQAMVQAINYVTHVMGIKSVAEYVENEETLEALRGISVDFAQGFGIAMPQPFMDAAADRQANARSARKA